MKGNIWENRNRCTLRVEFGEATRRKAPPPSPKDLQAILGEKKKIIKVSMDPRYENLPETVDHPGIYLWDTHFNMLPFGTR